MSAKPKQPYNAEIRRQIRAAALHRGVDLHAARRRIREEALDELCGLESTRDPYQDGWERWPGMPLTIADPSEAAERIYKKYMPYCWSSQVLPTLNLAISSVKLTMDRIEFPNERELRALFGEYRKNRKGRNWTSRELLDWVERFQYWLDEGAKRDNDVLLRAAGVNEHAVGNRVYDPATSYADLHVISASLDMHIVEQDAAMVQCDTSGETR